MISGFWWFFKKRPTKFAFVISSNPIKSKLKSILQLNRISNSDLAMPPSVMKCHFHGTFSDENIFLHQYSIHLFRFTSLHEKSKNVFFFRVNLKKWWIFERTTIFFSVWIRMMLVRTSYFLSSQIPENLSCIVSKLISVVWNHVKKILAFFLNQEDGVHVKWLEYSPTKKNNNWEMNN